MQTVVSKWSLLEDENSIFGWRMRGNLRGETLRIINQSIVNWVGASFLTDAAEFSLDVIDEVENFHFGEINS